MKTWTLFRFETAYQLRQFSTWLFIALFLGLTFLLVLNFVDEVREGDYLLNAPVVTAAIASIASLLGLLVAGAVSGSAATRDARVNIVSLLYTAPISKLTYLLGRFLSAFAVSALVLATVPVGLLAAYFFPGADPALYGPFQPMSYISAYFLIALPNVFVATAILFALASLSRSTIVSFLAGAVLFIIALVSKEVLADHLGKWELAKQLDFSGFTLMGELKQRLTPQTINTEQLSINGWLLWNRTLWLMIGVAFLFLAHFRFRFAHYVGRSWFNLRFRSKAKETPINAIRPVAVPQVQSSFGKSTLLRQTLAIALRTFQENVLGWAGLAILAIAALLLLLGAELLEGPLGVPSIPTTGRVAALSNIFIFRFAVIALVTLYTGQLVWRARDARISDITDAAPVPDGVLLASKLVSTVFILIVLQVAIMLSGMIIQVGSGYYKFEIGLYLRMLLGLQLVDYLLFAVVAMAVHVLVNQKYTGYVVVFLAFLFTVFHGELGVEQKLLVYGAGPGWAYSDMSGFGHTLEPWAWFKLYWAGWAILLAVVARLFRVRGRETSIKSRLRQALIRPPQALLVLAGIGAFLIYSLGAFVFYNTNTLNGNYLGSRQAERRAAYERLYGKYNHVPQPLLTAVKLKVELYPSQREAQVNGSYTLVNKGESAIDSIHLATASEVETSAVEFSQTAELILADQELGHSIYRLQTPLQPGDSLQMRFTLNFRPQGFSNQGINNAVAENGTFVDSREWMPAIGYQPNRELTGVGDRKLHQLPPKPAMPSIYNTAEKYNLKGWEKVRFEAEVGTAANQTAIAPGALRRTWTENGRTYFLYASDAPIRNIYAFFSAKYEMREAMWNDVRIQVYHHPGHGQNIERMIESAKASLAYYTKHFGPYPYGQLKLVEKVGPGAGATAFAGTITFTEGFATLNPAADPRQFDLPYAVVGHEIAHQWWAHQLAPAPVEGAALLTESLAWYSALGVVQESHGAGHLERLLYVMRQSYLTPRSRADVPLLRANDAFQAYRKGPFAMYSLREHVGAEKVSQALRNLLAKYGSGQPPLPTSLALYKELRTVTPDSLHYLLTDLFEENTFWEMETKSARAVPATRGAWQVTLEITAQKVRVDTAGRETEVPMDEWVEIGAYATNRGREEQLYLQRHRVISGKQQITLTVPGKPSHAGIDPRHLLMDTGMENNLKTVKLDDAANPGGAPSITSR